MALCLPARRGGPASRRCKPNGSPKLAWAYLEAVQTYCDSANPKRDVEIAWQLAKAADAADDKSPFLVWAHHWLMAPLLQWHDRDFEHSIVEAEAVIRMAPYDARAHGALSYSLANAGKLDEAIEWGEWAFRHDPNKWSLISVNLSWAYFLAGRYEESLLYSKDYGRDL